MSELAVAALRLGLLAAIWVLIIAIVASQGRDLMVGRRNKVRGQKFPGLKSQGAQGASAVPAAAVADAGAQPQGGASTDNSQLQKPISGQTRALASRLVVTEGPLIGREIDLQGAPLMMGRAQECDLVLDDDYVSGRHARLFPQGTRWFLEDLGSTNGTYVDGAQLARTLAVEPGTPMRIGKTVLELRP